jgi:hypothetical protein
MLFAPGLIHHSNTLFEERDGITKNGAGFCGIPLLPPGYSNYIQVLFTEFLNINL